ncbi:MAG: hypothetical protein LUG24_04960 [Clostridiales bacterium]|nr:hypothetical protein [Clostridiales bacterium]
MTDGSRPGHVIKDIKKLCSKAEICCEAEIRFDSEGGANLIPPKPKSINGFKM